MNKVPAGCLALLRACAPSWHAGKPDAMLDNPEQLSIGQRLRCWQPHVGSLREQIPAHLGVAAAIVRVAARAMVGKVGAASVDDVGCERYRISLLLYGRRNSEAPHGARESRFYRVGLRKRAQIASRARTTGPQPLPPQAPQAPRVVRRESSSLDHLMQRGTQRQEHTDAGTNAAVPWPKSFRNQRG